MDRYIDTQSKRTVTIGKLCCIVGLGGMLLECVCVCLCVCVFVNACVMRLFIYMPVSIHPHYKGVRSTFASLCLCVCERVQACVHSCVSARSAHILNRQAG